MKIVRNFLNETLINNIENYVKKYDKYQHWYSNIDIPILNGIKILLKLRISQYFTDELRGFILIEC